MKAQRYAGMAVAGLVLAVILVVPALIAWSIIGIRSLVEDRAPSRAVARG